MEIIPGVHLLSLVMANVYLIVEEDGLTLIDAGVKSSAHKILKYITSIGEDPHRLKRILITHADMDHVGAPNQLREIIGAQVFASQAATDAMAQGRPSRGLKLGPLFSWMERFFGFEETTVDGVLSPGEVLPVLGGLTVIDTKGHTPGHISFYAAEQGILFAGDSLRTRPDGIIHNLFPMITWDAAKAVEAVNRQAEFQPNIVCPGHGPVVYEAAGKFPASLSNI